MAPTPSPRSTSSHQTPSRTPQSRHRLNFKLSTPLPTLKDPSSVPTEHPVEVISRVRNFPADPKNPNPISALEVSGDQKSIRVGCDIGYRDFSLDGVSISESEDLEGFYQKYVRSRIEGVRLGAKCTIMMYGPTGSGKSHTMFGCSKQQGIVYRALRDILGEGDREGEENDDGGFGIGGFVQVAVLEIYNEEIYDLLSGSLNPGGGGSIGIPKGSQTPKVRLEVMGKKAKNATYIYGNAAGKISREVAKVEKRRIVKSTNCNERSSRSHCLIILDVPSVGGRLMLVDMAGSENIEQAGQTGFEAKMQTAKINQGNTALKRVVESIANGDSHVPFRDSKLTMLLQDSFEDDKSKILMILCASPDPKEMHKTISTLEYGAKAKCIVRAAHLATPKDKGVSDESGTLLRSRIVAMNQFIYKLQMENKQREKERDDAQKELAKKEEELLAAKSKLQLMECKVPPLQEEEIKAEVEGRTQMLRHQLMRMEEKVLRQQEELGALRQQLAEMQSERGKVGEEGRFTKQLQDDTCQDIDGSCFAKRLMENYAGDQGMVKSMELDMGDIPAMHDVKEIKEDFHQLENHVDSFDVEDEDTAARPQDRVCLSTVFEMDDEGEEREIVEDYEVDKEVVEVSTGQERRMDELDSHTASNHIDSNARKTRIQNIFRLCGNYRELAQQVRVRTPSKTRDDENTHPSPLSVGKRAGVKVVETNESPVSALIAPLASLRLGDEQRSAESQSLKRRGLKENCSKPDEGVEGDGMIEVCVKWEASKEFTGNIIKKLKVLQDSTLSDMRKQIEVHLEEGDDKQPFTFLLLGDPTGAPVMKEKEAAVLVSKLPVCNNTRLACIRPAKRSSSQRPNHVPFGSLENTIQMAGRA